MKNNTLVTIIITLIIAGGGGYMLGKGSSGSVTDTKVADDSIRMMKEQSASIKTMGEMMRSNGSMMQEAGAKYKDEGMMSAGKDMEMVGGRYLTEDAKATSGTDSMKKMMDN
ncbi:MAG: hypothetical protein UX89_C0019G0024 [Parcubacteria group bacterium GW2011_GWA2_47_16]|nr:MAG: hypothetical protein UX89_C0019G0024 [Parcubacteria group bacterium GW2011_GWA2_47_16]